MTQVWFSFIGSIFEIIGVFLMANGYLSSVSGTKIEILCSAICRGKQAKNAGNVSDNFGKDTALTSLQGLAFIAVGFILQAVPYSVQLFQNYWNS